MTEAVARRIENKRDLSPHMLRMMFDEPFFARILRGVNTEFGRDIPTAGVMVKDGDVHMLVCLLYTSPSPRDKRQSRMPSSA